MALPDEILNYYADRFVASGFAAQGLDLETYLKAPRFHEGRLLQARVANRTATAADALEISRMERRIAWCGGLAYTALAEGTEFAAIAALRKIKRICDSLNGNGEGI